MKTRPTLLSLVIASVFASGPVLAQLTPEPKQTDTAERMGTISVIGEGDRLGAGQMIQEEQPKARSTATRSSLEKARSTSNPYQGLELLPGVNTSSHDATGLFGGSMRVRGFNSDQMGFTIDGSPVNDSGSFTVFPQEYTDQENTCELFVTQGTPDTDAPHVGASGGNIGIVTCDPLSHRAVRIQQTLGQLNLSKTFVRFDTGKLNVAEGWRTFISYSHAEVDKFRGKGGADRDHIDFRTVLTLPRASRLLLTALWNDAVNNNYRFGTRAQFAANENFDFAETFIGNPTPVAGTRQAPVTQDQYYKLALNPFKNAIITGKANLNVTDRLKVDIEPYYWYGYGTGGVQQFTLNEGGTFRGGVEDVNRDGDRLDSVIVYRSSLTNTNRPGINLRAAYTFDIHRVTVGAWYERARHRQTGPATRIDNEANIQDLWLRPGSLILRADGTPFNLRDQLTISTANSVYINDTVGFFNEKLRVDFGVKRASIERDYTNFPNEGTGQGVQYTAVKKFSETLPNIGARWQFTASDQVFANIAKNYKAPGNFSFQGAIVGGVNRIPDVLENLKNETAVSADVGYRHYGKLITFSGSLFNSDFKDRLARRFVPEEGIVIDTNVGDGRIYGVEAEVGTTPIGNMTFYASTSYTRSENKSDLRVSSTNTQPTAGKDFPDTPRWLASFMAQYAVPAWYVNAQAKYTGKRFATLTNDESVPAYTVVNLNAGWRVGNVGGFVRNVLIRANWSNIFNKRYLSLTGPSGSLFTTNATGTGAQAPQYLIGAPRFFSMSVSAEF